MNVSKFKRIISVLLILCFAVSLVGIKAEAATFTNPIGNGADPWVVTAGGKYYLCGSDGTSIFLKQSVRLQDIANADPFFIWTPPEGTSYSKNVWAPELHYLDGRWYVYFAADDGDNINHRMYVLEGGTDANDPFNGTYIFKGKISDSSDNWAIDGTVMIYEGNKYFIWSGWANSTTYIQNLYIAPMSNPWTISGPRVEISRPEYDWEIPDTGGGINEGPEVLIKDDTVCIIYSANGSWTDDYCLGQLKLTGTDVLSKSSWTKKSSPAFEKTDQVFGPGHCCFVKSLDGTEDWIVYHAAKASGAGWDRNLRMQKFTWNSDNTPNFGAPAYPGTAIEEPSGTQALPARIEAESAAMYNCYAGYETNASGAQVAGHIDYSDSYVKFTVNADTAGQYILEVVNCNGCGATSSHKVYINNSLAGNIYYYAAGWNSFTTASIIVTLNAGTNTIKFMKGDNYAEIDYISFKKMGTVYEGENATLYNCIATGETNASGGMVAGYIDYVDSYVEFDVNVANEGIYTLDVRYCNGSGDLSYHKLSINNVPICNIEYYNLGWNKFATTSINVKLNAGSNLIKFQKLINYAEIDFIGIRQPNIVSDVIAVDEKIGLPGTYTASSAVIGNEASNAQDGSLSTFWQANSTATPQWLQVDLGDLYTISNVEQIFADVSIWSFKIEGSVDGLTWVGLVDKQKGASGRIFSESVSGTYRYVKLTVLGSSSGIPATSVEFTVIGSDRGMNIAMGKPMTASTQQTNYEASKANDQNTASYWCANSSSFPQYLTVDLGSPSILTGVEIVFRDQDTWKYKIEGSNDNVNWGPLLDNTAGVFGATIKQDIVNATYRYVKITITGSARGGWAHCCELRVYGYENLALGKTVTASTSSPGYDPSKAFDSNHSTYWCATSASKPQWINVDLGGLCSIKKIEQFFMDNDTYKFTVQGSTNNTNWTMLMDKSSGERGSGFGQEVSGVYRYIKLTITYSANGHWANSNEFRILGVPIERDLLVGKVAATASSFSNRSYNMDKAMDGDTSTFWCASSAEMPQWIKFDLGNESYIKRIEQTFVDYDTYKFKIEGSNNNETWYTIVDFTGGSGVTGRVFSIETNNKFRYIKLTVAHSSNGHWANSQEFKVIGIGSPVRTDWWDDTSGVMRYYLKKDPITTLNDVKSQLDTLKMQGYNVIELFAPYEGPGDIWCGLGATNNYAIDPAIGTMDDFTDLINEVHSKGMKVTMFANLGYSRDTAPFFFEACDAERTNATNIPSRYWYQFSATDPQAGLPVDDPSREWFYSSRAEKYYRAAWNRKEVPSYNFNNQQWRDECVKYLQFWMDKGLDGIALDAVSRYVGINADINNQYITNILDRYNAWTNPEGCWGQEYITQYGYKCMQEYSITGWSNAHSLFVEAMDSEDASSIEPELQAWHDRYTAVDGIDYAAVSWEKTSVTNQKRMMEIAGLTTIGTMFFLHSGLDSIDVNAIIDSWPQSDKESMYNMIRTQNSYKALSPAGSRTKLLVNGDLNESRYYAFLRTNKDGSSKALVIMNFQNSTQTLTVNLSNLGISTSQTPINLYTGTAGPKINSPNYTVTLPAYGYLVLGVK